MEPKAVDLTTLFSDVRGCSLLNLPRMGPDYERCRPYAGRVAEFRRTPPPAGGDGVTAFDEK